MMAVQFEGAPPNTAWDLVTISSAETKAVLVVLAVFSLISWFLIAFKWWQLRRVRQQGNHFFGALEQSRSLEGPHDRPEPPAVAVWSSAARGDPVLSGIEALR